MKRALAALVLSLLPAAPSCGGDPRVAAAREAVDRTLDWLRANRPDPGAHLAERGMDIWTWNLVARLHPDAAVREDAAGQARERLRGLVPPRAPNWIALSWWVVILRCADDRGMDTRPIGDALVAAGLERLLDESSPTTAWWSSQLLRHAGLDVESTFRGTAIARAWNKGADWSPSARDAVAFYHEIAAAADFGRRPLTAYEPQYLDFARRAQPRLVELTRDQKDTDAVAELVVAGALLGQRDEPYFGAAVDWLLEQQNGDGTYRRQLPDTDASDTRHAVLVATWALLAYLQGY